jgi:nucleotidyltransferase/DNA polymerase involved in DNA repair
LAEVLRSAEYLISFDAYTALVHEATLCGCPVVVKDDGNWNLAKAASGPMRIYGAVDDESKLDEARAEVGLAYQAYLDYMPEMELQLNRFIEMTQAL